MDWQPTSRGAFGRRWVTHAGHDHGGAVAAAPGPHARVGDGTGLVGKAGGTGRSFAVATMPRLVTLDGSHGEGGGQILRTALALSLLTGRPFRIVKIRANREKPGLRPQHLTAVTSAAALGNAEVTGAAVGSRDLTFRPGAYEARDLDLDIGTAGSTAMVLHTLHLPLALRAREAVRVTLTGGTFNTKAPSYPFLATTWRAHMAALGAPVALAMPSAGFYPRGGGRLDAWIEPASLRPLTLTARGRLLRLTGEAGVSRLNPEIAARMERQVSDRLAQATEFEATPVEIALVSYPAPSPGAAIALTGEYEGVPPVTFVGLGERGKPAESVASEAVDEGLSYHHAPGSGALDPHSADQVLLPLSLTPGRSEYTVSAVTDHLRTNSLTIQSFLDRRITIHEPEADHPGRVVVH